MTASFIAQRAWACDRLLRRDGLTHWLPVPHGWVANPDWLLAEAECFLLFAETYEPPNLDIQPWYATMAR